MIPPTAWVFDVDATIIDGMSGKVLRPLVRETFSSLADRGRVVVLWSAGGAEYAHRKAVDHGLTSDVAACFGKDRRSADGAFDATAITDRYAVECFVDDLGADPPTSQLSMRVRPYLGGSMHDDGLRPVLDHVLTLVGSGQRHFQSGDRFSRNA